MGTAGEWDVKIKTPIGTLAVLYVFTQAQEGPDGLSRQLTKVKQFNCGTLRPKLARTGFG